MKKKMMVFGILIASTQSFAGAASTDESSSFKSLQTALLQQFQEPNFAFDPTKAPTLPNQIQNYWVGANCKVTLSYSLNGQDAKGHPNNTPQMEVTVMSLDSSNHPVPGTIVSADFDSNVSFDPEPNKVKDGSFSASFSGHASHVGYQYQLEFQSKSKVFVVSSTSNGSLLKNQCAVTTLSH